MAARYESTWQVGEAIAGYDVARVPGAYSFPSFNTSAAILFSLLLCSANCHQAVAWSALVESSSIPNWWSLNKRGLLQGCTQLS